jgi:hypothetical protein
MIEREFLILKQQKHCLYVFVLIKIMLLFFSAQFITMKTNINIVEL